MEGASTPTHESQIEIPLSPSLSNPTVAQTTQDGDAHGQTSNVPPPAIEAPVASPLVAVRAESVMPVAREKPKPPRRAGTAQPSFLVPYIEIPPFLGERSAFIPIPPSDSRRGNTGNAVHRTRPARLETSETGGAGEGPGGPVLLGKRTRKPISRSEPTPLTSMLRSASEKPSTRARRSSRNSAPHPLSNVTLNAELDDENEYASSSHATTIPDSTVDPEVELIHQSDAERLNEIEGVLELLSQLPPAQDGGQEGYIAPIALSRPAIASGSGVQSGGLSSTGPAKRPRGRPRTLPRDEDGNVMKKVVRPTGRPPGRPKRAATVAHVELSSGVIASQSPGPIMPVNRQGGLSSHSVVSRSLVVASHDVQTLRAVAETSNTSSRPPRELRPTHGSNSNAMPLEQEAPPPSVQSGYKKHLDFLKQRDKDGMPELYRLFQTFWVPQRSNFFVFMDMDDAATPVYQADSGLGALPLRPSSRTTVQVYNPSFFFWDPFPLVMGELKCPERECRKPLKRAGTLPLQPRKVVAEGGDLSGDAIFWIIGAQYRCYNCKRLGGGNGFVCWASTDEALLSTLPAILRAEYPAVTRDGRLVARQGLVPSPSRLSQLALTGVAINQQQDAPSQATSPLVSRYPPHGTSASPTFPVLTSSLRKAVPPVVAPSVTPDGFAPTIARLAVTGQARSSADGVNQQPLFSSKASISGDHAPEGTQARPQEAATKGPALEDGAAHPSVEQDTLQSALAGPLDEAPQGLGSNTADKAADANHAPAAFEEPRVPTPSPLMQSYDLPEESSAVFATSSSMSPIKLGTSSTNPRTELTPVTLRKRTLPPEFLSGDIVRAAPHPPQAVVPQSGANSERSSSPVAQQRELEPEAGPSVVHTAQSIGYAAVPAVQLHSSHSQPVEQPQGYLTAPAPPVEAQRSAPYAAYNSFYMMGYNIAASNPYLAGTVPYYSPPVNSSWPPSASQNSPAARKASSSAMLLSHPPAAVARQASVSHTHSHPGSTSGPSPVPPVPALPIQHSVTSQDTLQSTVQSLQVPPRQRAPRKCSKCWTVGCKGSSSVARCDKPCVGCGKVECSFKHTSNGNVCVDAAKTRSSVIDPGPSVPPPSQAVGNDGAVVGQPISGGDADGEGEAEHEHEDHRAPGTEEPAQKGLGAALVVDDPKPQPEPQPEPLPQPQIEPQPEHQHHRMDGDVDMDLDPQLADLLRSHGYPNSEHIAL